MQANDSPTTRSHLSRGLLSRLSRIPPKDIDLLFEQVEDSSVPSLNFYFMLAMATAIAAFGLISNSAPAIIGAMIVAPLMSPIIGFSFASVMGEAKLAGQSLIAIATGIALVIGIAYLCASVIGLRVVGSEIAARTAPSTLDLLVALFSGAAAAFAYSRSGIANSIAGVAIAVALVPPLTVVGIGLALGDSAITEQAVRQSLYRSANPGVTMAGGAFLLFLTNLLGIVAAAVLVFGLQGYGHLARVVLTGLFLVFASTYVVDRLAKELELIFIEDLAKQLYVEAVRQRTNLEAADLFVLQVRGERSEEGLALIMNMLVEREKLAGIEEAAPAFRRLLSESLDEEVSLRLEIIPISQVIHQEYSPEASALGTVSTDSAVGGTN